MKCPLCENDGRKIAFIICYSGKVFTLNWFDKDGQTVEEELDEWEVEEPVLITCSQCYFTGLPGMFKDELELPEIKRDELGPYLDDFLVKIGSCTIRGKLYLDEEVADKCMRLHMILTATSTDQLPEGLVNGSPEFRKVAATRFAKFALGGGKDNE